MVVVLTAPSASSGEPSTVLATDSGRCTRVITNGHAVVQAPKHHRVDEVVIEAQSAGRVDVDPAPKSREHLHRRVVGQAHQVLDRSELPQVPVCSQELIVAGVGAAAGHPVHRALGHQILEGPSHRLPGHPVARHQLRFGG